MRPLLSKETLKALRAAEMVRWECCPVGPWGISYAVNLTPDKTTGLGIGTEEMFIKAMRAGKHMGVSRDILPPMPWQNLAAATDEDLKAIYAFLRPIPPVTNHVPDMIPPGGPLCFE